MNSLVRSPASAMTALRRRLETSALTRQASIRSTGSTPAARSQSEKAARSPVPWQATPILGEEGMTRDVVQVHCQ
jgi:hypothetical protein